MNDLMEEVVANVESDSDGVVMNNLIYDLVNVVVDNSEADVHGDEAGKIGGDEMGKKEVINGRGEYHGESREIDDGNDIFGDYDNGDGGGGDAGDDSGGGDGGALTPNLCKHSLVCRYNSATGTELHMHLPIFASNRFA